MVKVSIGICAHNEEKHIEGLLRNLLNEQELPSDSEIIVVCSGCTDSTPEIVKAFSEKDERVKLVVEAERRGKISALNKILNTYQGDVFVNIDADHNPSKGAIPLLLSDLNDSEVGAVAGNKTPVGGTGFIDKVQYVAWGLHAEANKFLGNHGNAHLGAVLYAIRKGICNHIPEDVVNDDSYVSVVCKQNCYQLLFEENAYAYFPCLETIGQFVEHRRRVIYGHLKVKEATGMAPAVLEMIPLKAKLTITARWIKRNLLLTPYFMFLCLIELWANILARWDYSKNYNPHVVWRRF